MSKDERLSRYLSDRRLAYMLLESSYSRSHEKQPDCEKRGMLEPEGLQPDPLEKDAADDLEVVAQGIHDGQVLEDLWHAAHREQQARPLWRQSG